MKNLRQVLQSFGQRITHDTVLTAIGEMETRNRNVIARGVVSSKASGGVTLQNGGVIPKGGMNISVEADSFWIQVKDAVEAWMISSDDEVSLVVTGNTSGNTRIDLVEGRYAYEDLVNETVDIIDPSTGVITPTAKDTRRQVKLEARVTPGTPGVPSPAAASAATYTGTNTETFDLSTDKYINLSVDGAAAVQIDCSANSVGHENAATAAEVVQSINAVITAIATVSGGNKVKLTSTTTGEDSTLVFTPPSANDATNDIFGLSEAGAYEHSYVGERPYFKLAEVVVIDGATVIAASDIYDVDEQSSWTADVGNNVRITDLYAHQTAAVLDHPDGSVTQSKLAASVQALLDSAALTDFTHGDRGVVEGYEQGLKIVFPDEETGIDPDEVRVDTGAALLNGDSIHVPAGSEVELTINHTPTLRASGDTLDTRIQVGQTRGVPLPGGDYEVLDFSSGAPWIQDLQCYFDPLSGTTGVSDGQAAGTAMHTGSYNPLIYREGESGEVIEVWDDTGNVQYTVSYDGVNSGDFDINRANATITKINLALGNDHQIRYTYALKRFDMVTIDGAGASQAWEGAYTSAGVPVMPTPNLLLYVRLGSVYIGEKDSALTKAANYYRDERLLLPLVDQTHDVIIRNQADWDYWFGDVTELSDQPSVKRTPGNWIYTTAGAVRTVEVPPGKNVLLLPCMVSSVHGHTADPNIYSGVGAGGYKMTTQAKLGTFCSVEGYVGDQRAVVSIWQRNQGNPFFTDFTLEKLSPGVTMASIAGSRVITIDDTGGLFKGDWIFISRPAGSPTGVTVTTSYAFNVESIVSNTSITVDRPVAQTGSLSWLRKASEGIVLRDFAIDGKGGLYDSSSVSPAYLDAHMFHLKYLVHSQVDPIVRNVYLGNSGGTGTGGVYNGEYCEFCKVGNVHFAQVDDGGIVLEVRGSEIHDISGIKLPNTNSKGVVGCDDSHVHHISEVDSAGTYAPVDSSPGTLIEHVRGCRRTSGTADGGGVSNCSYSVIRFITSCEAGSEGGGVAGCSYSDISHIMLCYAPDNGGGVSACNYSRISDVHWCKTGITGSEKGGGVYNSDYSTIQDIHNCSSEFGGGVAQCDYCRISTVFYCHANEDGGGVYDSDYCHIEYVMGCYTSYGDGGGTCGCWNCTIVNISYCTAAVHGGGICGCHYSMIMGVFSCDADTLLGDGGGVHNSPYCTIEHVQNCDANNGGGVAFCDECVFLGRFRGNTSTTVSPNFHTCLLCIGYVYHSAASVKISAVRETWDNI